MIPYRPLALFKNKDRNEAALEGCKDETARSNFLWTLGNVALRAGNISRAEKAALEKRKLDKKRGDEGEAALASGLLADILYQRGELDEALRIRREEQLPVCERLGDVRGKAVTMGRIADILDEKGESNKAIDIYKGEVLPVYNTHKGV